MNVDWGVLLVILIAIVAARVFQDRLSQNKEGTQVSAEVSNPASSAVVYANPIDEYITEHYPNARR